MISPAQRRFLESGAALRALFGPPTVDARELGARAKEHLAALEALGLRGATLATVQRLGEEASGAMRGGPVFRAIVGHYVRQLRELGVLAQAHDEPSDVTLARVASLLDEDPTLTHERVARVQKSRASGDFEANESDAALVRRARVDAPLPSVEVQVDDDAPSDAAIRSSVAEPASLGRVPVARERQRRLIVLEPAAHGDDLVRVKSNYRLETHSIGAGGAARVFRAHDVDTKRQVAVKIVTIPDESRRAVFLSLFNNERRLQGAIAHDAVVQIHKSGLTAEGLPYLVMELLGGGTLADYIEAIEAGRKRFALDEALRIGSMAIAAAAVAHRAGILHKDIKPENYLFTEDHRQLKLGDFGVAQRMDRLTTDVCGTLGYIPQETFEAQGDDQSRDVFAIGVTLYRLLTGHAPFDDDSASIAYRSVKSHTPKPPSHVRPERAIPPSIDRVVMTAIARDRNDRYVDADGLLADFVTAEVRAFIDHAAEARDEAIARGDDAHAAIDAAWAADMRLAMRRLDRIAESFPSERLRRFRVELAASLLEYAEVAGEQPLYRDMAELMHDLEPRDDRLAALSEGATALFGFDDPAHLLRKTRLTYVVADFEDRGGVTALRSVDSSPHFVRTLEYERGRILGVGVHAPGIAPVFVPLPVRAGAHRIRIPIYAASEIPESGVIVPAGASATWSRRGSFLAEIPEEDLVTVDHDFVIGNLVTVGEYVAYLRATEAADSTQPRTARSPQLRARFAALDLDTYGEPIRGLRFDDALAYLDWVGGPDGPDPTMRGARLPTVHELKRACRGNDARAFPWGDAIARNPGMAAFQYARGAGVARPMPSVPTDAMLGDRSPFSVPATRASFRRAVYHLVGNVTEMLSCGETAADRAALRALLPEAAGFDPADDSLRRRAFVTFGSSFDRAPPTTADVLGLEAARAPDERSSGRQLAYGFRWVKPLRNVSFEPR